MRINDFLMIFNNPNYIAARRMGKTRESIKYCAEHWCALIVADRNRKKYAEELAHKMHMDWEMHKPIRVESILDKWLMNVPWFIDEIWYMDTQDVIDFCKHNKVVWYNWTMPQLQMKKWKEYTPTEIIKMADLYNRSKETDPEYIRELTCDF